MGLAVDLDLQYNLKELVRWIAWGYFLNKLIILSIYRDYYVQLFHYS